MTVFSKILEFVMDILETVTFIGSLFIVIYLFVAQPHQVRGSSMDVTFRDGQYIMTDKLAYRIGTYKIGDVVVFDSLENADIDYIKRIIALPNDAVKVEKGLVYVNDKQIDEPYLQVTTPTFDGGFMSEGEEIIVPEGYLFLMGDNRPRSADSRSFGPVPEKNVIGKVFFRYYPTNVLGRIQNPFEK